MKNIPQISVHQEREKKKLVGSLSMPVMIVGAILVIATVATIFFNAYILFLSCTQNFRQTRTTTHILLLHLGVINLLIAAIFLTALFPAFLQDEWLGKHGCKIVGSVWFTLHVAAIWTLTALNVDKYVAIASPLHYARFVSPGRVGVALSISWALSGAICTLPLVVPGFDNKFRPPGYCVPDVVTALPSLGISYALIITLLGFLLPAILVASANGRILIIARHHRHRIVSALWDVTVSAQATVTPQRSHFYLTRYRGRSAAATVFHFVGTFIILYMPSTLCLIYEAVARSYVPDSLSITNFSLFTIAPAINGFVYGVKSKVLRKNFKNFLRKRLYRSEVNYEIQSRASSVPASRRPSITPSLSLPLQQKLQRRMSEILIPPTSTPSDGNSKLIRQSSELSFRVRGSNSSITTRDFSLLNPTTESSILSNNVSISNDKQSDQVASGSHEQVNTYTSSPLARSSSKVITFLKSNSLEGDREQETETNQLGFTPSYHSNHRPSLRRALFARNKQKSLDFEMTCLHMEECPPSTETGPPRSASQQHVAELSSPSLVRPLLLEPRPQPPLSPARKTKRVSWSSDSFSNAEDSPMDSDNDTTNCPLPGPMRYRKRAMFKNNGLRFDFSKLSLERIDSEDTRQSVDYPDGFDAIPSTSPKLCKVVIQKGDPNSTASTIIANGKYITKSNGGPDLNMIGETSGERG
ncbi:5-hydroxytryptamine receptor 6-like [Palaemon carinicauda]|uniref:5-hydroxytryptamine receptor 6-like n=1 Tax=Palaemon carinicauda TaxID=392227 RepID=UPI0035B63279